MQMWEEIIRQPRSFVILTALSWHAALLIQEILMFLEEMLLVSILQWII